jgi:hypothetical protein
MEFDVLVRSVVKILGRILLIIEEKLENSRENTEKRSRSDFNILSTF